MNRRGFIGRVIAGIFGAKAIESVAKADSTKSTLVTRNFNMLANDKVQALLNSWEFKCIIDPLVPMKRICQDWRLIYRIEGPIEGRARFEDSYVHAIIPENEGAFKIDPGQYFRDKMGKTQINTNLCKFEVSVNSFHWNIYSRNVEWQIDFKEIV